MPVPQISVEALAALLSKADTEPPVLLDVRRPEEYVLVHLPDAVLIPLQELEERAEELDAFKGKQVVVYCHHGIRSLHGAAFLRDRGLDATSLSGGIDRWSLAVDPTVLRY